MSNFWQCYAQKYAKKSIKHQKGVNEKLFVMIKYKNKQKRMIKLGYFGYLQKECFRV